jgi:hypothetical protein
MGARNQVLWCRKHIKEKRNMKKLSAVGVGLLVLMPVYLAVPDEEVNWQAEAFVDGVSLLMKQDGAELSKEEQEALRKAYPVLLRIADHEVPAKYLWKLARFGEPKEIDWEAARKLILSGKVMSATQKGSLVVVLIGRHGRRYKTEQPKIDVVFEVMKEVDPKGVFMSFSTE